MVKIAKYHVLANCNGLVSEIKNWDGEGKCESRIESEREIES